MLALLCAGRIFPCVAEESAAPVVQGGNAPGMKGVVYGFFDDKTGGRIGRLEIETVGVEYQHRGFLRVAWDPLVVLDGVTLEIGAGAVWPEAGAKIIDALRVTGRSGLSVMRRVHLRIAGTPVREITAATATLGPDGSLTLAGVTMPGSGAPDAGVSAGNFCFWLAGAQAGQLIAIAPTGAAIAQTISVRQPLASPTP